MTAPEKPPDSYLSTIKHLDGSGADQVGPSDPVATPVIVLTEHGPYRVVGDVAIYNADGALLRRTGTWCLCRCGEQRAAAGSGRPANGAYGLGRNPVVRRHDRR